jgi:hypothetical protein
MHHKNFKILKGTEIILQNKEFGFNILTEKIQNIASNDNEEAGYTVDAQILQSILEYSIDFGTEKYFKSRDISKNHLLVNCKYYVNYYRNSRINKNNRPENMNPRVVELLEKLTHLELLEVYPFESTNHQLTKEYRFTNLARMVAFLLKCNEGNINKNTANQVVDQIFDYYNSLNNSHAKFCLIFLKHCRINHWFDIPLQYMIDLLLKASSDKDEFLNKIKFLNTIFIDPKLIMWGIFKKSLEHLFKANNYTYELFLLHLKLFLEEIVEYKSRKFKDFEIKRLEKAQELDTIALEGYCSFCKDFSVYSMKTTQYLGDYIKARISQRYISKILCSKCNKEYLYFEHIVDSQSSLGYFDNAVFDTEQTNEKDLIKKIFEFDQNENISTEKAQRFQWIIRFLSDGIYHNITDTQDEVLSKVPDLFNIDINENPSENKKNTNGLFNRHIDKLEKWNLIETILDRSSKGGVNTRKFRLTVFGKMVSSIIETILTEDKKVGYDKLFDSWKSHLAAYTASLNSFCMIYLDKCKEKGIFDRFAEFYLKSFTSGKNRQVQNVNDLFTQMILVKFEDDFKNSILFDIWKQSFNELDEKTRQLFSNQMRIYLNRITSNNAFDYGEYETKRFEVKDKTDQVITEARCIRCSDYQYIAVNVVSYLSYFFDQPDENIKDLFTKLKCKNCREVAIICEFEY